LLSESPFFEHIKFYSNSKNSPGIKKVDVVPSEEEYKDASVDTMVKLSNDLKSISSRKTKIEMV
jgi:hypothetical protein